MVRHLQFRIKRADPGYSALDRRVGAADLHILPDLDRFEQQKHHPAHKIAQRALQRKADRNTRRSDECQDRGQRDPHHAGRGQDHDNIQDQPDQVIQETFQRRFDFDLFQITA